MLPIKALENEIVKLIPLKSGDWQSMVPLNREPSMWTGFPSDLSDDSAFESWMEDRVALSQKGQWYPFLITYKKLNQPVGLSCYLNVDEPNHVLEIGGTWYGKSFQGTEINPNCKLLLMTYAFEDLGYERGEYKTDVLNTRSRRAIEKLGAKQDGIMRSNRIVQHGRRRDTVYYSILRDEWPSVKQNLELRISAFS